MESPQGICERTFAFALRIIRLCTALEAKAGVERVLARQLLRSGTSIGANVEEAQAGHSRADFAFKIGIALKEARETHYWLRLLRESQLVQPDPLSALIGEGEEIAKILGAIVRSTKKDP